MVGSLTVVSSGSMDISTADDVAAASAAQVASDLAGGYAAMSKANRTSPFTNADGTRTWTASVGTESADHHLAILEMLPAKISIKPGDKVVWLPHGVNEPHTVTFPTDIQTDAVPLCEGPNGTDTFATPTVNPPQSLFDFGCNGGPLDEIEFGGGNGVSTVTSPQTVSDSGLVMTTAAVAGYGVPSSGAVHRWTVSFKGAAKGTYTYVCQIHDGMAGTIVVN
jgi:plastocyanin